MAYPQGINFRQTLAFVTDGANESWDHAVGAGGTYPHTTAQGNTVGWEGAVGNDRDRSSSVDRRLAGVCFTSSVQADYRFDLPAAGSYNVRFAAGDMGSVNDTLWSLLDTTTSLATLTTGTNVTTGSFKDATNAVLTAAAWPGSNTLVNKTFSTTICRFRGSAAGAANMIAHAYVEAAAGGSASYSYSAAGGLNLSGVATKVRGAVKAPAGGVLLGGAASQVRGAVRSSSGGLTLGGAATILRGLARTASGGLLFAGSSGVSFHSSFQQLVVNPVGGMLLRGGAAVVRSVRQVASGGFAFAGHALKTTGPLSTLFGLLPILARRRRRN